MGLKVDPNCCIGCGVCAEISPNNFRLNDDEGHSVVVDQASSSSAKEASESCPVSAITES